VGPIIVIPFEVEKVVRIWNKERSENTTKTIKETQRKLILVDRLTIESSLDNDIRYKGIYKVPVYTSQLKISGEFDPTNFNNAIESINNIAGEVKIGRPYLSTTVSDPRGINSIPSLNWAGKKLAFEPGSQLKTNSNGIHAYLPELSGELRQKVELINFNFNLELRGMETLSFIPIGEEATINVSSSWPHPEFLGMLLPVSRTIESTGYSAQWKITSFASNIEEKLRQCEKRNCNSLYASGFGVRHIEPVNVYLQSERSVKYGLLFIGLSFITFFIFETV